MKRHDGNTWVAANFNLPLEKGDVVQTGGDGIAKIVFVDGTNYATHQADSPSLTVVNNRPTVAFRYSTDYTGSNGSTPIEFIPGNFEIFVTQFTTTANGSSWTAVGPAVPTCAIDFRLD